MTRFILSAAAVYVVLSLPAMLGIGNVICFAQEVTWVQEVVFYSIDGLSGNFLLKLPLSLLAGIVAIWRKNKLLSRQGYS